MITIIDDFMPDYARLRARARKLEYATVTNPVDGVEYPLIAEAPADIREAVEQRLRRKVDTCFFRASPEGVHCPHPVHHDLSMGQFSLMVYLFDRPNSGTGFVAHTETGVAYAPRCPVMSELMADDTANLAAWTVTGLAQAVENRAVVFPAGFFHVAQPVGGFGRDLSNCRLVLTAFFS